MDRQTAQRIQTIVNDLSAREDQLDDRQRQVLNEARSRLAEATATTQGYTSAYRGFGQGLTLRGGDELVAAVKSLSPDITYADELERQRRLNLEAELADPEGYRRGEFAGMGTTGALSMAVPSVAAARLPALTRMGIGAAEGAALATAPEFLGAEGGFGPRIANVSPLTAAAGAGAGALAPVAGQAIGGIVRGAQNLRRGAEGFGSRAIQTAARGVGRTQRTGEDIRAYLDQLGPEAMLADVPGGPRAQAMGLATMQGEGGTVLSRALTERGRGSEERISDTFNRLIAEPNAAFNRRVQLAAERRNRLGSAYDEALTNAAPLNINSVSYALESQLQGASGQAATQLRALQDELKSLASETGEISAQRLHGIRSDVSGTISEATRNGRGDIINALKPVLQRIDDRLDTVEGYAATRGSYADNMAMERAIDDGRRVFSGGTTTETPDQLRRRWAGMTDAEKEAFRLGAREYVAALMGTSRNAPATAWGQMTTGFNQEKMAVIFGPREADEIVQLLRGEQAFSQTRGEITGNSMSAMREAAREDIADLREPDTGRRPGPIARGWATLNEAGNAAVDAVLYGPSRSRANQELGRILSMRGEERDKILNVLLLEAERQQTNTRAQAVARMITEAVAGGLIPNIGGGNTAPISGDGQPLRINITPE